MLMVYSPPGLEGMMRAMYALSPEQLTDGALTSRILAEHDTIILGEAPAAKVTARCSADRIADIAATLRHRLKEPQVDRPLWR